MASDPDVVVVLGSGLGAVVEEVRDPVEVGFDELPGFPPAGVTGHAGRYVSGRLAGRNVLVQAGRYHLYEGYSREVVAAPVRLAAALGVRFVLFTNASGAVAPRLEAGALVLIDDHLNLTARSPLTARPRPGEARFPDMSAPYDPELQAIALDAAARARIPLQRGVYAGLLGPSYETPAEVRMVRVLGGDVVGMSTVSEVIVARALGLRCLVLSVVANRAAGLGTGFLEHAEVVDAVARAAKDVGRLIQGVLERLPQSGEAK